MRQDTRKEVYTSSDRETAMSIKAWIARQTSNPSQYANAYASGLVELTRYLAASLVAFSGKQPARDAPVGTKAAFETFFDMEQAGFEPVEKDIASLVGPSVSGMAKESIFNSAYQDATAFLCLYSDNAARNSMRPQNADQFSRALRSSVTNLCAGQFGFQPEPRNAVATIEKVSPVFVCKKMLNVESFGKDDGLGTILNHLRLSPDRQTLYAFVVGSRKQSVGCASHFLSVIEEIDNNINRCARDLRW